MHTDHGHRPDPLTDMGYETRDVNYTALTKAIVGFFIFSFACAVAGYIFLRYLLGPNSYAVGYKAQTAITKIPAAPNPLLQNNVNAKLDIQSLRNEEDSVLDTTGWANSEHTRVHIPIDRAIDILATRGIPTVNGEVSSSASTATQQVKNPPTAAATPGSQTSPSVPASPNGPNPEGANGKTAAPGPLGARANTSPASAVAPANRPGSVQKTPAGSKTPGAPSPKTPGASKTPSTSKPAKTGSTGR